MVGLRDSKLSERLQLDADLTLETAITKARQSEAVHKQQPLLRGKQEREELPVAAVKRKPQPPKQQKGKKTTNTCSRCGRSSGHEHQQCPARDAKCRACGKLGHYCLVCRSTGKVREVRQEEEAGAFLGAVSGTVYLGAASGCNGSKWETTVSLNGVPVKMKIDTG